MESEARLLFLASRLPMPELQYSIIDHTGRLWRVDFAWPDAMIVAEYDSIAWHVGPEALLHDRLKTARLQECGWTTIPMTVDDIRHHPNGLIARIDETRGEAGLSSAVRVWILMDARRGAAVVSYDGGNRD